jgi:hypothetical protein
MHLIPSYLGSQHSKASNCEINCTCNPNQRNWNLGVFGVDEKWLEFEGFRESKSMLLIP